MIRQSIKLPSNQFSSSANQIARFQIRGSTLGYPSFAAHTKDRMTSQGLVDTGKQKMSTQTKIPIEFNDLGSTENLILEDNMNSYGSSPWRKRIILTAVTVFFLALFGLMLFAAFPRRPIVSLVSFDYDEKTPSTPDENGQLLTNWIGKVSIISPNYYDVGVKSIDVKAFIPSNDQVPVGFGTVENVVVKGRDETIIAMNFKVPVYQPSSGNPSLIEECMNNGKAILLIKADIDLNISHWTGKRIHTSLVKTIDCALPQLYRLVNQFLRR